MNIYKANAVANLIAEIDICLPFLVGAEPGAEVLGAKGAEVLHFLTGESVISWIFTRPRQSLI